MRILLINPIINQPKIVNVLPNIGLAYLATALRRKTEARGQRTEVKSVVEVWDGLKKGKTYQKLEERLRRLDYDLIGFQVFTVALSKVKEEIGLVKSLNPKIIVVVGGPHPSADPQGTLRYLKDADFGIVGEGEISLPRLVEAIEHQRSTRKSTVHSPQSIVHREQWETIPGLVFRKGEEIVCNQKEPIEDLDSLGHPSWDLIDPNDYPQAPIGAFVQNFPLAGIQATRGCPYNCTFCAAHSIMGRKLRSRRAENVLEEIELLYNNYGVREIHIVDDNFTFNKDLVKEVCEGITRRGIKVSLAFPNGIRLGTLNKEILQLLELAGCYSVSLGIESGSARVLEEIKKKQTVEEIREKVALIKEVTKIRITGFFIIGFPQEEEEDILKTISLAKELPLSRAQFAMYLPIPGSEMYERLKEEGKMSEEKFNSLLFQNTNCYLNEKITLFRFKILRLKAYFEFYLRPRIIWGLLREIKSLDQLRFIIRRIVKLFW